MQKSPHLASFCYQKAGMFIKIQNQINTVLLIFNIFKMFNNFLKIGKNRLKRFYI